MNEWWLRLSTREQKLLFIAGAFFIIMIVYFFIWSPIGDSITTLQKNVAQDRELLSWMKITVPELQQSSTSIVHTAVDSANLFTTIENALPTFDLKSSLTDIKQNQDGSVTLTFNSIDFDTLIDYLINIQQYYGIIIITFNSTKLPTTGYVKCEVELQHS